MIRKWRPTNLAKQKVVTPLDLFELFVTPKIIDIIEGKQSDNQIDTDDSKIRKSIGLLLMIGVL